MDIPTRLDLFALGRQFVQENAKKLDPAQVDVAGSDANLFVGIGSVIGEAILRQLAYRTGALMLDGADDEDLDRWAYDHCGGMTRKGASSARGEATLIRETFALGAGTIPIGTTIITGQGYEYTTTTAATFGASQLQATCNVRAAQAGKATQAGANTFQRFAKPQDLFDATIQATNPRPMAGGEDAENDDLFKQRVREFWRTARRGVLGAIEFGALAVEGVVSAQAVEVLDQNGNPARVVLLYISDSTGVASEALAEEVRTSLNDYRAAGITVLVSTSIPQLVSISLVLNFVAGVDTITLSQQIRAAVFEFVNSLPVNAPLLIGQLYSVLQRFSDDGLIPDQASIVAPVGDLIPTVGLTIRTTLELIEVA